MQIKSKVYYEINTGNVLLVTSEMEGCVVETTKEQDIQSYEQLKDKTIDEVNYIELEYGTLSTIFTSNLKYYSVNLTTKLLECVYYTKSELNAMGI